MNVRPLLNPDLAGWRMAGSGGFRWIPAESGMESFGGPGLLWYAEEAFGDCVLTVEWRVARAEDNSGVFLRCPPLGNDVQPAIDDGYEVQIDERGFDPEAGKAGSPLHMTGAIYKLAPALRRNSRPIGCWNTFEVRAVGPSISVSLNGVEVSRMHDASRRASGHIALQSHHDGSAVQFRNLNVAAR